MKKSPIIIYVLLATTVMFFMVGFLLGQSQKKETPINNSKAKDSFFSGSVLQGNYPATLTGKIKDIDNKTIILENGKQEIIFKITKDITVSMPYKASTSSAGTKSNILQAQVPATIDNIKFGQMVSAEIEILEKDIALKKIHILIK